MESIEIALEFNESHFREIYYAEGEGSLSKSKLTRKPIIWTILLLFFTFILYVGSFSFPSASWLILISAFVTTCFAVFSVIGIVRLQKWKSEVEKYLTEVAKYKSHKLVLNENSIELHNDDQVAVNRWDNIKKGYINDKYILLHNDKGLSHLLPAKSMEVEAYKVVRNFISRMIK